MLVINISTLWIIHGISGYSHDMKAIVIIVGKRGGSSKAFKL